MSLELSAQFSKCFNPQTVIEAELRLPLDRFSVTVLFGPSGCGKTTVLRCLAGLERPEQGTIALGEALWFDSARRVCLAPQQRCIGCLFQEYALFPHLRVGENIGYSLRRLPQAERQSRVAELLTRFDLQGLERRYPYEVSGGQQQRIALARAVACRPRLLLLDEPLAALDTSLRVRLRGELRRMLTAGGTPTVVVTHDRTEAVALADQVVVMHHGQTLQTGPPEEVFSRPVDSTVAEIVGVETVVRGAVTSVENGLAQVQLGPATLLAVAPTFAESHVHVCIRAEDVTLQKGDVGATSAQNRFNGVVMAIVPEGPLVRVSLDCGFPLTALVTRPARDELQLQTGDAVRAVIKAAAIHLLPCR